MYTCMASICRWMVVIGILLIASNAGAQTKIPSLVLVVSIDALHPEALQRATIPTIRGLMQKGAYSLDGRSTEPPKTLIAHAAMFTGLSPLENGKMDNQWASGETTVQNTTFFNHAKNQGFKTGYFYSKEKLGYLVNNAIDVHQWSRDNAIDLAETFIKTPGPHFVFLHVNGLDEVGPQYGWLSPEYLEELSFIDDYLATIVELVTGKKHFLLVVTSDHAGHGKVHGSDHPDDYRLPLVLYSDTLAVKHFQSKPFGVIDLKRIVEGLVMGLAPSP